MLNLLHVAAEDSPKIVSEIIAHKRIRHINVRFQIPVLYLALCLIHRQFTGSDRVGKIIASQAAKYLKPCVLELGGKSAAVVSTR